MVGWFVCYDFLKGQEVTLPCSSRNPLLYSTEICYQSEVGIYKRKQESKKETNHAFDQEGDQEKRKRITVKKKERKQELDQVLRCKL